jgi:hypothetical protein
VSTALSVLLLGFVLGVRHATDADHVVAVSAIASRERSVRSALGIGASWGVGHALTVLLVGGAIILFQIVIPPRLGLGMEFSVAIMLIVLGFLNISGTFRDIRGIARRHAHDPTAAPLAPASLSPSGALRSLGVGVVHGLAGSAAVALLVLASIRDSNVALAYLGVFGVGTIVGMVTLTSALALPMAYAAQRFDRLHARLARGFGLLSVALGLVLAYRIGFVDGLFGAAPSWSPE